MYSFTITSPIYFRLNVWYLFFFVIDYTIHDFSNPSLSSSLFSPFSSSHFTVVAITLLGRPRTSIHTILWRAAMHIMQTSKRHSQPALFVRSATERFKSRSRSRNLRCPSRGGKYTRRTTMSRDNRGEAATRAAVAVSNLPERNLRPR